MRESGRGKRLQSKEVASPSPPRLIVVRLILLLSLLYIGACSEDENPLVFDEGPRGDPLVAPETLLVGIPTADAEIRPSRTTGTSLSLLAGTIDAELEARGLLRFGSVPDTAGADTAYVRLHLKHGRGEEILLALRRVLGGKAAWSAGEVTYETAPETDPVALGEVAAGTGSIADSLPVEVRVPIPVSLVGFWRAFPDSNGGLEVALSPAGTPVGVARIVSHHDLIFGSDGLVIPTPALVVRDLEEDADRVVVTTEDAYVVEDLRTGPDAEAPTARLGAGNPARYVLKFDSSTIPPDASIVRAVVRLPVTPGQISSELDARLAVYTVTEDWEEATVPDTLETASSPVFLRTFEDPVAEVLDLEIGALVQAWIDGTENQGILVRFADETARLQDLEVLTSESTSPPTLTVHYLLPLDDRWKGSR
jgi:hypothetical protein